MNENTKPREESVQTPRFRAEHYTYRHFAVYDADRLVVVTVYRKGAVEVARRLNGAERVVRHLIKLDGSDGRGAVPSPA